MIDINDITIDNEFKDLIPALSQDEYAGLVQSVMTDGFTDPIIVWLGHNILVDGHNRLKIWRENLGSDPDKEPEIKTHQFFTRDDAKEWMLRRQLSRRNITDAWRVKLNLMLKPFIAARAKAEGYGNRGKQSLQNSGEMTTDKAIASASGVSHDTVHKVSKVLNEAPKEVQDAMLDGSMSVRRAYQTVKPEPEKKVEQELPTKQPNSVALERAHEAIARLRAIPVRDPLRAAAFDTVADWVKVNKKLKD